MTTEEKIQLKQKELSMADAPEKRNELQLQIKKLQLRREIEAIQRKIDLLS